MRALSTVSPRRTHSARPRPTPSPVTLGLCALAFTTAPAAQTRCPASTLSVAPSLEVPRWADAIREMRASLTGSDRPWHCVGATVRFTLDEAGVAALDVALPSGTTLRRHVAAPAELTATLQAALILDALPALEAEPAPSHTAAQPLRAPAPLPLPPPPPPPPAPVVRERPAPSSFIEGIFDLGMRLGATPSYTSFAMRATVAFRIRAWSLFAWGRVEPWTYRLVDRGPGRYLLDVGALGIGASWGARALSGRVETGLTVATNSYTWRDQALLPGQKETFVQVRLGAIARWRSADWHGLALAVTADADFAPVTVFAAGSSAAVPTPPSWSAGLMVGALYGGAL